MPQKAISNNENLAKKIRSRRNELGLTIEEASLRAGVGTKTWSRYESGNPIREDKCKGICKALNWNKFPNDAADEADIISIDKYKSHEAWSSFLEKAYNSKAALAFAVGSDILIDQINDDLSALSSKPKGTHIGELAISWLEGELPAQFLLSYDYNFLYNLKCTLWKMRLKAKNGLSMVAHSVIEELLFYLCNEEAITWFELQDIESNDNNTDNDFDLENWIFDLFGDMDIITYLYSNIYVHPKEPYHFKHWNESQFYTNESEAITHV